MLKKLHFTCYFNPYRLRALLLFFTILIFELPAFCSAGIWEYYINTYLNATGSNFGNYGGGTSFNNANLGSSVNLNSDVLYIDLTGCKTFQNSGDDIASARMFYRIYKQGGSPGAFIAYNLPYFSGDGNPNKEWQTSTDLDLLGGLTDIGTYVVEMYYEATGNYSGGSFTIVENNSGANFKANFTVTTPLPVELRLFQASLQNINIHLYWQTASELNNSHFVIQRSNDSRSWKSMGEMAGHGTTLEEQSYSFTDKNPLIGLNYYRLKQVDFDGNFEYSKVISINLKASEGKVNVFPNPVSETLFVNMPEASDSYQATVFDLTGKAWLNGTLSNNQLIVSELPQGIYFIRITDALGRPTLEKRFVKN